jgi:hypothetical protein
MTDPLITINDVRLAGHCVRGAHGWFAQRGLDFRAFVKNGERASVLLATEDNDLAVQVIERKKARENG